MKSCELCKYIQKSTFKSINVIILLTWMCVNVTGIAFGNNIESYRTNVAKNRRRCKRCRTITDTGCFCGLIQSFFINTRSLVAGYDERD